MDEARAADEVAIRGLVARYADAVVRRDEGAWAATWAEDAEWHILGNPTRGRGEIVALWSKLMAGFPWVAQLPNSGVVDVDGDRATGRWYITELGKGPDGSASLTLGVYHDEYRRIADQWYFARRRFDVLYGGPPDLSAKPNPFPEDL